MDIDISDLPPPPKSGSIDISDLPPPPVYKEKPTGEKKQERFTFPDRKSTRLNSSHLV